MAALDTLFFDLKINDMTESQMKEIKSRLEKELGLNLDLGKQIQQSLNNSDGIKVKVGANTEALENALKRISELVSKSGMSKSEISELNAITKSIKEINSEIEKESSSNSKAKSKEISDAKILEEQYLRLYNAEQAMRSAANGEQTSNRFKDAISKLQILMFYLKEARGDAEKTNAALSGGASKSNINSALKESLSATKELQKERLDSVKRIEAENNAMIRLKATIDSMELALKRYQSVSNSLGNPQSVEAAIQKMREYIELAKKASMSGDSSISFLKNNSLGMGASNIEKSISTEAELERQRQKAQAAAEAQERLAASHYRASLATDSHTRASLRLGNSLTGLISITGDLRNQIGMLISVYTVEHLLKNVVEIGGEFEKQKLAMGSMLGSLEQADDIFNRMKNLALTSPFNFKDLSNYSRQLAAYGTGYKDLYDTTNRLADISAGLGGDMSRLVLAFSQVKAAAYLRGQEMRQFTEFGVALPELLAEKYTKAEGRIVTAGDVIERVSKRMVSFNDVKDVLWQQTDKGGKFYGMQDVLAQSTSGMASNLKDAIDTMYYDIANSNSGVIKGAIKDITELVSHWRELTSALTAGIAVYSGYRLVMAASNRLIGVQTSETLKGIMASKEETASLLRKKALYTELTPKEKLLIATQNELTISDLKQLASSKAINGDSLIRLANSKKITATQALQLSSTLELSAGQEKYLIDLQRVEIELSKASGFYDRLSLSAERFSMAATNRLSAIGSNIGSFLGGIFTKANIIMTAAFVGIDAWLNNSQRIEKLNDSNTQSIKNAEDGLKNLKDFINSNPIDATIKKGNAEDIEKLVNSYKEQITSTPLDMSGFILNISSITDAKEQLIALRNEMESMKDADEQISRNGNAFVLSQKDNENGFVGGKFGGFLAGIDRFLYSTDQSIANLLGRIDMIPESFRNWVDTGDEAGKTIDSVISDVSSRLYSLQSQMYQITNKDINDAIEKMKKDYPEIAKGIEQMRDAGASNNEVIMAMSRIGYEKGNNFFGDKLDSSDINKYFSAYDIMTSKMQENMSDAVSRINSNMDKVDVEGHTEKWRLAIMKSGQEQAKALGLQGDALEQWNFMLEETVSKNSLKIKNHPKAYQDMYDGIKLILSKNGKDINNATKEQVNEALKTYINETKQAKPWLSNWLNLMNNYTRSHPIYLWSEMKFIGKDPTVTMTGNGKQLSTQIALRKWFTNDEFATMTDNAKQNSAFEQKDKQLKDDYIQAYKARSKNAKELYNTWQQFRKDTSSYEDWEWDETHSKSGNLKKTGNKGGGGTKEDTFLKDMQNRLEQVKKAMDVYKKWKDTGISESESIDKMDASGIFSKGTFKNIVSENGLNDWYKKTLENLSNMVKKAKSTPERKKYTESIAELFGEFYRDETKKKLEETSKQIEDMMSETAKKWDSYKQLLESGMSKEIASSFIFGGNTQYSSKSEALADSFYNQMSEKGRYRNIGFDITEDEAKKILGDDAIGKALLSAWKMAKDEIEKERIQIQFDGQKAISQVQGIADKIKTTLSTALDKAIRKNSTNGKETKLGDYAETGDNGLLKLKDGAEKILTDRELEMVNSYIEVTNQEITKLGSSLLELLPAWDDIFGKSAYMSLEQLLRGMREAKEIVENAKIVNDKNGKPSYFTSTYKDKDGNTQSVSGNIGELDRLRNQEDTRQGDINKKNPFVGMFDSASNYFSAKKEETRWSNIAKQAEKNGGFAEYTDENGNKQKISTNDAKSKEKDAQERASHAALSFSDAMKGAIDEMQKWNNALSLLGSTIEAVGGGTGASDAAGVAGGMLSGAASLSSFGPYGMAAGAAMGAITSIAQLHDKKLDRAIEKSKERVQELNLAYKSIEDSLKYNLGNAAEGSLVNNSEIQKVKDAQANVASMKSKGKLSIFDLMSLQKSEKILKESAATIKYLDENDKDNYGNAYNYQRNLYKEQLAELEKQKQAEEDKKKTDQSKVNDYNSQIEEMETKITQFSEDLANSLYGIDIKGWASQFGDALFEAWQKGESGAEAFNKTAASILQSLVKSWFKTNVIENAFKNLQKDLFGENGQGGIFGTNNDLTQEDISKIASDIMSAQGDITSKMKKLDELYAVLEKKGIDIKGNSSSSTTNAISGVSEQEANIIAAYMDAIRQDTYNMRMNLLKIVEGGVKIESSPVMQAQLLQLQQIQSNTYKNMELVGDIKSLLTDFSIGNKKIYVN